MIYSSLKIGPSGGIIADMEKVYQDPDSVTLAIGIGGTGVTALRTFKNAVYTRLIPDNSDREGEEPKFDRIKFLAIDSDVSSRDGDGYSRIAGNEYFGIGVSNIVETLNNKSALDSDFTLQWFDHEKIKIDTAKDGAGGVRAVGRFLIIKKAYELKTKIESILRSAMVGMANPNIFIHVFSGISGGTGSGSFIDVCYILQQALLDNGWLNMASVMGFFFLPDVNLNDPNFPKDQAHSKYVKENGYAAMKELDFLMNLGDGDEMFEQDYGAFKVATRNPPVNECHLISTTEIDGSTPANAFSYIMNAVSEYALNYVARYKDPNAVFGRGGSNASNELTLKGLVANLVTLRGAMTKKHGAEYRYNVMGASSAIIPYREIATYLATGLFKHFDFHKKSPNEANVREFTMVTGLSFVDLERELLNGVLPPTVPDMPPAQLKQGNAPLVNRLNEWYDVVSGKMRENYDKLTRELPEGRWDIPQNPDSVIGKVFKELILLARDPKKGPYFAKGMLKHDDQLAIDNVLEGIIKEVQQRIHTEQIQKKLREDELARAKDEFYNTGAINPMLNSRKKKYVSESINWINHLHNLERLSVLEDLVTNLRQKFNKLNNLYFTPLVGVMDDLRETFDENGRLFAAGMHHDSGKQYVWNIVELAGIKDTLDDEVKRVLTRDNQGNITADQAMSDFMFMMTENANVNKWMGAKEGLIAHMVSGFITTKFKAAIDKSMITYLRQKYNADGDTLINMISNNVIGEGLISNATPAFYADTTMFNVMEAPIQSVLSVPESEELIEKSAEHYRDEHGVHMAIRSTAIRDRISMMCFHTGIPMYSYRSLKDLEQTYKQAGSHGVHLYEKGDKNWRTYLPSPLPATCVIDTYEEDRLDRQRIDSVRADYDYASQNGLLVNKNDGIIELPIITDIDFENLEAKAAQSDDGRNEAIAELSSLNDNFMKDRDTRRVVIPSGIDIRWRENANIDVIVKYPKLSAELAHTVSVHKQLQAVLTKLSGESEANRSRYLDLFIQAVYSGVIKTNGIIFKYVYEMNGLPAEKLFTSATNKFNKIPIYQAANEFAVMKDNRLRKKIEGDISAVLDRTIPENVLNTAKKLAAFYDNDRMSDYLEEAKKESENEEIRGFLGNWKESLKKFIKDSEAGADFF